MNALHTAAAALSLVPDAHWTVDTHRANISSYDGCNAAPPSLAESESSKEEAEDSKKARLAADKRFKKELYHYLRWALSGGAPGPGIPETMAILGRQESVRRLNEGKMLTTEPDEGEKVKKDEGPEKDQNKAWMGSLAPR